MEKSGFFNSIQHDRVYQAADFAAFYGDLFTNGVFYQEPTSLQLVPGGGMMVNLMAGSAWINGYRYYNTGTLAIELGVPDGGYTRIDRIVLRWDLVTRQISTVVLTGVPSTAPMPPELTRRADRWELALADVYVRAGAGAVAASDILDNRLNPTLCGTAQTRSFLQYGQADTEALLSDIATIKSVMGSSTVRDRITATVSVNMVTKFAYSTYEGATGTHYTYQAIYSSGGVTITDSRIKSASVITLAQLLPAPRLIGYNQTYVDPVVGNVYKVDQGSCSLSLMSSTAPGGGVDTTSGGNWTLNAGITLFLWG